MGLSLKWIGFVTAVWVQAISGNNYTFSNYSDALKTLMNLTQLQLNNLSVAKDVGKAFGIFAGFASDAFPTSMLLLIGSVEGLLGYGAQWLVVSKTVKPFPYWLMCIFMCMGGNSTTWMNTAILVTCIRNFRNNRGPVSGILKGYVGLSTAIFTDLCNALFANSPAEFLVMLSMGAALGYKDVSMFVSLLSIMGFFGRIISGTVSEYCIKKAAISRPFFNAASQILNAIGYIIMAMAIPGSLYIGSAIIGLCYGVRLAVTVPTASELFGLKYYGLIYNILILNLPLGSFLFSGLLAGLLYDSQATVMPSGGNECFGAHCYRLCFLVMGGACVVGFVLDVFMGMRTREIYQKISASKTSKD